MKTVLFVPGFREDLKTRDYKSTIKVIEQSGYEVKFIPINWVRTTIDDWLAAFEMEYTKHDPKDTILAGFSFGAMIVFTAATKQNPSELWLFSLSPYFSEDIHSKYMRKSWLSAIGHRRTLAFDKLAFHTLARLIHCKTLIFAGEIEWPETKKRALSAEKQISHSELSTVQGAGHDVSNKLYIETIKHRISQ